MKALRATWQRQVKKTNTQRLVFVDESGATTTMTRSRARALRGERAIGAVPHGHWRVTTLLGALRSDGVAAAMTVDAPTDGEIFRVFVDRILTPTLRKGDVVVMDNLGAHKVAGIAEAITSTGAELRYLPPYSPDLSPIEPCWSKVKEYLRAAQARTQAALDESIATALVSVTPGDARGWFASCGYPVH